MTWGRQAYGRAALGGRTVPSPARFDGVGIPGYEAAFFWSTSGSNPAYGSAAYGGRAQTAVPTAGLWAVPDPAAALITVPLWWPYAAVATLTRVDDATGERTPVRDSPVALPAGSRRNSASNPKARDGLTGYSAGSNTALSPLTGLTTPHELVTTGWRMTASAAGEVSTLLSLDPVSVADTAMGFLVRSSALPSDILVRVTWYDASSQIVGTTTHSVAAKGRTQSVGTWSWATTTVSDPPATAVIGVPAIVVTGLAAGATIDVTARLTELVELGGDYFDGDFLGAGWVGTPGLSYSDSSPIVWVVDAEAPFDTPVHYELSGPTPGFVASSETVELASGRAGHGPRTCLLTHPGLASTIPVWIESEPATIDRDIDQARFQVIGRRRPVVVSAPQRSGDEGSLTFVCENLDERRRLLALLDDGSPLLLRCPASYGHPPLWWLSLGKASIKTLANGARHPYRRIEVPFVEVDRPDTARPLVA